MVGRKDNPAEQLRPLSGEAEFPWLWIGTWSMGGVGFGPHDEREAVKVLHRGISKGITHFDTAPVYGKGLSERLLAKVLKDRRKEVFISTKGGLRFEGKRVCHDARPETLRRQIEHSMKNLQTDYIDLYMLHWPDPKVSLMESIEALKAMKREGLIRYWGVCNLTIEDIREYLRNEEAVPHQVHFSVLCRNYALLEVSSEVCINCIVSPLEQGLLSDSRVSEGLRALSRRDIRRKNPYFSDPDVVEWVRGLRTLCQDKGLPTSLAVLLWTGAQRHVHALVVGPRRLRHMDEITLLLGLLRDNDLVGIDRPFCPEGVSKYLDSALWEYLERPALPEKVYSLQKVKGRSLRRMI